MNHKQYLFAGIIFIAVLLLGACSGPWQGVEGEGTITLNLGGGVSRSLVDWNAENLTYKVTLSGAGGKINRSFNGGKTTTISAAPGEWEITIRANNTDDRLRAMSLKPVKATVQAGKNTNAPEITVVTAAEAGTWAELKAEIDIASNPGIESDRSKIVVITGDLTADTPITSGKWNIILQSGDPGNPATITRGTDLKTALLNVNEPKAALTIQDLILDGGGITENSSPLVQVQAGALTLEDGAVLQNNKNLGYLGMANLQGGAVCVLQSGTFTMNGGTISGNTAVAGGGVFLNGDGNTFTIKDGTVSGNTAITADGPDLGCTGDSKFFDQDGNVKDETDGVYSIERHTVNADTWDSVLGTIKSSSKTSHEITITADLSLTSTRGNLADSVFSGKKVTLKGDSPDRTITLSGTGNLLKIGNGLTLTIGNNITLKGNSANNASLIQVDAGGKLVLDGGKITGNYNTGTGIIQGGGVYTAGIFLMKGGEISGNKAISTGTASVGGGVYVYTGGTFTKTGGIIYGSDGEANANKAEGGTTNTGHAVYVEAQANSKYRNSTAWQGDNIDTGNNTGLN